MQLQVDQHAPRAGARDVAVQGQSCFRSKRFSSSASLRSFCVRFLRRPPVVRQRRGPPPPRPVSSQALLGPPAPHVECKNGTGDEDAQGHADEEDGFRWGREDHFVEQCVVWGSVCVVDARGLKFIGPRTIAR